MTTVQSFGRNPILWSWLCRMLVRQTFRWKAASARFGQPPANGGSHQSRASVAPRDLLHCSWHSDWTCVNLKCFCTCLKLCHLFCLWSVTNSNLHHSVTYCSCLLSHCHFLFQCPMIPCNLMFVHTVKLCMLLITAIFLDNCCNYVYHPFK